VSRREISAAAMFTIGGGVIAAGYVWRRDIIQIVVGLALARVGWHMLRQWAGMPAKTRRGKTMLELAGAGLVGLVVGRHASSSVTHPCNQCGSPIGAPSRAAYCSPACRKYASLERAETGRKASALEAFGEVPY
jgi:hypothetical protein